MDNDWDLFAILRNFQSATTQNPPPTTTTITSIPSLASFTFNQEYSDAFPNIVQQPIPIANEFHQQNQLLTFFISNTNTTPPSWVTSTVNEEYDEVFCFPNIVQQPRFYELSQFHTYSNPAPTITTSATTSTTRSDDGIVMDTNFPSNFAGQSNHLSYLHLFDELTYSTTNTVAATSSTTATSTTGNNGIIMNTNFPPDPVLVAPPSKKRIRRQHVQNQRQKQDLQVQIPVAKTSCKKSLEKKTVRYASEDNLLDSWSWRKYGEKSIKGTPYSRNYYRCSSFKNCNARKRVQRSKTEPDMFIVTYTEDHSHHMPNHQNSLAGTTRNMSLAKITASSPPSPSSSAPVRTSQNPPAITETRHDDVEDGPIFVLPSPFM